MARFNDTGPYSVTNVYCATSAQNNADKDKQKMREVALRHWAKRRKTSNGSRLGYNGSHKRAAAAAPPQQRP